MNKLILMLSIAVMTAAMMIPVAPIIDDAEARRYGGGSSFSRSSFRSSSRSSSSSSSRSRKGLFSSYKKPKSKQPSHRTSDRKFTATPKKGSRSSIKTGGGRNLKSSAGTTRQVIAAKQERAKFKKPTYTPKGVSKPTPTAYQKRYSSNPTYNRARSYDSSTYYTRRSSYLGGYNPPVYVYNTSPSFGMWDTIILYSMLNNMNRASSFSYHHRNDADYQAWRREADRLAQDNAELRTQLVQMDAASSKMSGPVKPGYVPEGMDADLLLSQEARQSQVPMFRVCVGGTKGAYYRVATQAFAPNMPMVNMIPVTTSGTPEILANIASGKCDGGFAQGDGYWNYVEQDQTDNLPFERVTSTHKEAVHMICNAKGPSDVTDLSKKHKVWFPAKSGAATTFQNWIEEDADYDDIQTVLNIPSMNVASNSDALLKVASNKNSCMMYVAAPGATQFLREADALAEDGKIKLIDVNDWDFNDTTDPAGTKVYKFGKLSPKYYPNLLKSAGFIGSGSVEVPYLNADFLVANAWKTKNAKIYSNFALSIMSLQANVDRVVQAR